MKFRKLLLALASLFFPCITTATVKLMLENDDKFLEIKLPQNNGLCYTAQEQKRFMAKETSVQICLENEISFGGKNREDHFNFDEWYEPGRRFKKVDLIRWQEIDTTKEGMAHGKTEIRSCQAVIDPKTPFDRDTAPNAEIIFDRYCGIKIFNPKENKFLKTVSLIYDEKTKQWKYASLNRESEDDYVNFTDYPELEQNYAQEFPAHAKEIIRGRK